MALLYSRKETPEEIIITFKNHWFILIGLILFFGPGLLYFINFALLVRFMMFALYKNWWFITFMIFTVILLTEKVAYIEINKAMRQGKEVKISGQRYSSKNPLTYRIKK